jgi:hypothetical protein
MTTLELIPLSWFSWNFSVLQSGSVIAGIEMPWWKKKVALTVGGCNYGNCRKDGVLTVGDCHYGVYSKDRFSWQQSFILASNATLLARAEIRGWRWRSLTVMHGEKAYNLKRQSFWWRAIELLENGQEVGSIVPRGLNRRKAVVKLPDNLPTPVQIFVIWLAVIMWRHEQGTWKL